MSEAAYKVTVHRAADRELDGLSRGPLKTIREYGWMVSGFTIRTNSVSVVAGGSFPKGGDS